MFFRYSIPTIEPSLFFGKLSDDDEDKGPEKPRKRQRIDMDIPQMESFNFEDCDDCKSLLQIISELKQQLPEKRLQK